MCGVYYFYQRRCGCRVYWGGYWGGGGGGTSLSKGGWLKAAKQKKSLWVGTYIVVCYLLCKLLSTFLLFYTFIICWYNFLYLLGLVCMLWVVGGVKGVWLL